jgi:hypothetical protein
VDKARKGIDDFGASKFYNKWLSDSAKSETAKKGP